MLRKSQLILAAVLIVVSSGVVSFAVSAAMPPSFLAQGTTRYAVVHASGSILVTDTAWHDVTGLSTNITIPTGMKGDVMIIFCAEAYSGTPSALFARALVQGAAAVPATMIIQEQETIASHCAFFSKIGVGAGTRTVRMQWKASNTFADLYNRSMFVIVNLH